MRLDRAGVPFIAGALLPAVALVALGWPWGTVPFAALASFFGFFFRDPERDPPRDANAVVAPADGRVLFIGPGDPMVAPAGRWQQISIFLSPLDVHVNRIPVSGRVTNVSYRAGRFLPAYHPEASTDNERSEIWIDHGGQTVVCRQVVGVLARRVVCRLRPGMDVSLGQRFGIMKFGSRADVFLPPSAAVHVARGDAVRAGETILAELSMDGTRGPRC